MSPITKLWNSVVEWFNAPAVDEELPCGRCPLRADEIAVVGPDSTAPYTKPFTPVKTVHAFTVGDVASMSSVRQAVEASARRAATASITREEVEALIAASEKRMRALIARNRGYGRDS